jgi:hypothetical protein
MHFVPRTLVSFACVFVLMTGVFGQRPASNYRDPTYKDSDKLYPDPTITAMAPVTSRPGYPPTLHIHIQFRAMQYVCIPVDAKKFQRANLKIGMALKMRESGKYVYVRNGGAAWVKLRLLQKEEWHNL